MKRVVSFVLIGTLLLLSCHNVAGFYSNGRWNPTAIDGATGPVGTSVTVTWSLVRDGTTIPGEDPSNLIFFMDNLFGSGPGGNDYTQRPWFRFFNDSFGRWSELSGLTFIYEPADDGTNLRGLWGSLGVRGDVRIGGAYLDGNSGTLASTSLLNDADLTIDTGDITYYGNSAPSGAYLNIHNTLMHEIGHAVGLGHIESSSAVFLMEPFTNATINGPQLDDIRGVQYLYGDVNEKGAGNNRSLSATPLGIIAPGTSILHGEHASTGTFVLMGETDFLSISNSNDFDYFSFEVTSPSLIDLVVTPLGPNYNERVNSNDLFTTTTSASLSDLSLELFASGSVVPLVASTSNPIGQAESILDFELLNPGEYLFRVSGSSALTQMYQFSLSVAALDITHLGDFDNDGEVDGADFLAWQRGESPAPLSSGDLADWQANYGVTGARAGVENVPESGGLAQLLLLSIATELRWSRCSLQQQRPVMKSRGVGSFPVKFAG
jgi:hypothetical protein